MNRSMFSHQYTPMNEDERVATLLKSQREKLESIKGDYWSSKAAVEKLSTENHHLRTELGNFCNFFCGQPRLDDSFLKRLKLRPRSS